MRLVVALLALLLAVLPAPLLADELRPGYFEFTQESETEWHLVWKAPMTAGLPTETSPLVPDGCSMGEPARELVPQAIITRWPVTCEGRVRGGQIGLSGFAASMTDVLLRVAPLDRPVQVARLTAAEPVAVIAERSSRLQVAGAYLWIGVEHILFGFDHLLFVIALVLLLRRGWAVAKAVTAFTVAHSITLVGTTLGVVGLPQRPVEAVIALSVVFLAVEVAKQDGRETPRLSERIPWIVAFLFGLLHGFGFAGALAEIGLPEGEVPMALLAFNIGVELGQLAIVFAALAVLRLARSYVPDHHGQAIRLTAYGIGITASFWLIQRVIA